MKTIAEIEAAIAPLDAAVLPIAKSGFDLSNPGFLARWRDHAAPHSKQQELEWRPALDRAGLRDQADSLISEIIERYAAWSDERAAIRALFRKYDCFRWAASLPHEPMTADLFHRTLVLFSIK